MGETGKPSGLSSCPCLLLFLLIVMCHGQEQRRDVPPTASLTCEPLTASFCETVGYNSTGFPNILGQRSQVAAELIMQRFYPLVQIGCFDQLVEFVCSAHVPECRAGSVDNNSTSVLIMPCRSFCEAAQRACGDIVDPELLEGSRRFWPYWVTCDPFPTQNCRGFSETDEKESAQPSGLETSRNLLHDLQTAGDSLSAHIQNVIALTTSGRDSCQRIAVVKGLEYALKGVQENIEMCSTFLRILDDDT